MSEDSRLKQVHVCDHENWEALMEKLFWSAVHPFRQGMAIFTNTERRYTGDKEGQLITQLSPRIKKEQKPEVVKFLKQFTREGFDKVYEMNQVPEGSQYDFVKVVDSELPNNSYCYFIHSQPEQERMGKEMVNVDREKRAILVYAPLKNNLDTMRVVTAINSILDPDESDEDSKKDE
ncbi:MAG: hypothetical protein ACO4AU_14510 [bacterium]|jgi:hypothetical protein